MTKELKLAFGILMIVVISLGLYLLLAPHKNSTPIVKTNIFDPLNATYTIENQNVTLINGQSEVAGTTRVFGEPVLGDLNNDGINDAVMLISQDTGGSGVFYYVVAAIDTTSGAQGTNAVFLGDRIAPQNIEINNGKIIANYVDRGANEPMVTPPSIGVSTYLIFDGSLLKKIDAPKQTIDYLVSSADSLKYCDGDNMDSTGYQKTITVTKSTTTLEINPTTNQIIKEVLSAATTGMCHDVITKLDIKEDNGTVYIPNIEGWAGVSITMCSCKPQVEVNLLQIPGIKNIVWSTTTVSSFDDCVASGNPITESYPRRCNSGNQTFTENIGNELEKTDLISIATPRPNETVSSPLVIKGQARGSWFFEASFPVFLTDWDGKIIAQGIATTKDNWMTTDFVPFEATLNFTVDKNAYSNQGSLILKKDNPSGLAANDNALEIPVTIK